MKELIPYRIDLDDPNTDGRDIAEHLIDFRAGKRKFKDVWGYKLDTMTMAVDPADNPDRMVVTGTGFVGVYENGRRVRYFASDISFVYQPKSDLAVDASVDGPEGSANEEDEAE